MLELINQLDTSLFLYLNSFNSPFWDEVMHAISYNIYLFLALLIFICALGIKEYKKQFALVFLFILIGFGLSDSISSKGFKDNIKRLRPCHEPALKAKVHTAKENCGGGKYGFVSSHASNSFALVTLFWLFLGAKYSWIKYFYIYAGLVSYSRIYLARHYPLDIIFGGMLGILCGYIAYKMFKALSDFLKKRSLNQHG